MSSSHTIPPPGRAPADASLLLTCGMASGSGWDAGPGFPKGGLVGGPPLLQLMQALGADPLRPGGGDLR